MTSRPPRLLIQPPDALGAATSVRDITVAGTAVRVVGVGLACCALEVVEGIAGLAVAPQADTGTEGGADTSGEVARPQAHVVVAGGTLSLGIKDDLDRVWAGIPEPKVMVAFGACTISGGPYWDSYAVLPGLQGGYGPTIEVPGCPPRPDVLTGAVQLAVEQLLGAPAAVELEAGK